MTRLRGPPVTGGVSVGVSRPPVNGVAPAGAGRPPVNGGAASDSKSSEITVLMAMQALLCGIVSSGDLLLACEQHYEGANISCGQRIFLSASSSLWFSK